MVDVLHVSCSLQAEKINYETPQVLKFLAEVRMSARRMRQRTDLVQMGPG